MQRASRFWTALKHRGADGRGLAGAHDDAVARDEGRARDEGEERHAAEERHDAVGGRLARRIELLEARIEHLESAYEGLQDSVYRQAVLADQNMDDLRRRVEPDRLARELSQDARKRGL